MKIPSLMFARTMAWAIVPAVLVHGVFAVIVQAQGARAPRLADEGSRTVAVVEQVGRGLRTGVTIDLQNVTLRVALDEIARKSGITVMFARELLPLERRVSVQGKDITVDAALRQALSGTAWVPRPSGNGNILLVESAEATRNAAQGTITGRVIHAKTKQPVVGATVMLDDATKGVVTGSDGTFRIPATVGTHTLRVRALGFNRQAQTVTVAEDKSAVIEVTLEPSASVLNEVIVTGTVVATERKAIPNPITVITADDIEKRGITRLDQLFRGEVPGVMAIEKGTQLYDGGQAGYSTLGAMATSNVYARGSSNLQIDGAPNPLKTYVDGIEIVNPAYLGTIDPKSIERIEIITGPQAATVYGSGAMGGVMQIFTKKGSGRTTPDVTVSVKYGILENNIAPGKTPMHNDGITLAGGAGAAFSYAGNVSYVYSGQWQPGLFNRTAGASLGVTHTTGPVTASASGSTTFGRNGTANTASVFGRPYALARVESGEYAQVNVAQFFTQRIGTSSSQTIGVNLDYRANTFWQHHLTVGKSQTSFGIVPVAPANSYESDTLFSTASSNGDRMTMNYNTTLMSPALGPLSSTLTLGVDGTRGKEVAIDGCMPTKSAQTIGGCYGPTSLPRVSINFDTKSWGGFGTARIGVFERLYLTFGLRGERNPAYGTDHRIDWTPTNGATYTMEYGDVTLKLLASYGRATRPPQPTSRLEMLTTNANYDPSRYVWQLANEELRPEYSRGPQGGFELYYGNVGSLTVNHYSQRITDLIQSIDQADSVPATYIPTGQATVLYASQYQNAASVRQYGWESTASLNLGALTLRGTYSWSDSRILTVNPKIANAAFFGYYPGASFAAVPTHTGNVTASYARGGTSVTFATNYVGSSLRTGRGTHSLFATDPSSYRIATYVDRRRVPSTYWSQPGYLKSDMSMSQRLTPWASATLNVTNIGNSFASDAGSVFPTLGRQTLLGVSMRFPNANSR